MDSVPHLHISDTGIIVHRQLTSQERSTEEKKLKILFAASAVSPTGWEVW